MPSFLSAPQPSVPALPVLSGVDVLRYYDEATEDLFTVPLEVEFAYTRTELVRMPVPDLQALATARKVFAATSSVEQLVLAILNSQRVPIVWAQREDQWAQQQYATGAASTSSTTKPDPSSVNPIYPIFSVWRLPYQYDATRFQGALRRKIAWTSDGNRVLQAPQPIPLSISYQVEFMCLDQKTANQLDAFVARLFSSGPPIRRLVEHGDPWGLLPVFIERTGMQDLTQLDLSPEDEQKVIRHAFTIVFAGWMPQAGAMVPTVRTIRTDVVVQHPSAPDEEVLELDEVLPDPYSR